MKKKSIIDDGFNPELVETAVFDGLLEIPIIKKPQTYIIPQRLRPFSKRNLNPDYKDTIMFYEHDLRFRDIITETKKHLSELKKYSSIISPDASLYYDMPLVLQMANIYINRQIGHFFQAHGFYVIPNVRWGDERTYKRIIPSELPAAFLGLEKKGIYSIGTYGCCQSREEKSHLREGLRSFILEIEPEIILVYGPMPDSIFGDFKNCGIQFYQYDNWIKLQHEKRGE